MQLAPDTPLNRQVMRDYACAVAGVRNSRSIEVFTLMANKLTHRADMTHEKCDKELNNFLLRGGILELDGALGQLGKTFRGDSKPRALQMPSMCRGQGRLQGDKESI